MLVFFMLICKVLISNVSYLEETNKEKFEYMNFEK